jgi:PAS domain S-box-containing protein
MAHSMDATAERTLQKRFRRIVESAEDGIILIEGDQVVCTNDRIGEILGYSAAEIGRMGDLELAAPEERQRLQQMVREAREQGLSLNEVEYWAVRKDGSRRYIRNRYSRVPDGDGTFRLVVATSDLTGQKVGQQALRQEEQVPPPQAWADQKRPSFTAEILYDVSRAIASAESPAEILRAAVEPAAQTGAHVAVLMKVDVDADNQPELAEVLATAGETTAPVGSRFYVLDSAQAALLLSSPDRPLLIADLGAPHPTINEEVLQIMQSIGACAFAVIPLRTGQHWQGVVTVAWPEPHEFSPEEEQLYNLIGSQLAARLQVQRLHRETEHRAVWSQTAAEVSQAAASVLDPDELLQRVVTLVHDRFDLYYAGLFLVDRHVMDSGEPGSWAMLRAGSGEAGRQMVLQGHRLEIGGASMIGQCLATKQPRVAMDVGKEAVRFANPFLEDTRTELALPLISRGEAVGALSVQSTQPAAFSEDDIAVLQTMADQLAIAIDNANMLRQAQERAERERRVRDITERIHRGADSGVIMRTALEELGRMLGASKAVIRLGTQAQLGAGSNSPLPSPADGD